MRKGLFVAMARVMPRAPIAAGELLAMRRKAGLHIFRAAELLHIDPLHLSKCERGERQASPELITYMRSVYCVE